MKRKQKGKRGGGVGTERGRSQRKRKSKGVLRMRTMITRRVDEDKEEKDAVELEMDEEQKL